MSNKKVYWKTMKCKQCSKTYDVRISHFKRGGGKFCSISCSTTYRNIHNNPTKCPEVRKKISKNHVDVSGKNNPMYGVRGKDAPSYIDGRNSMTGETYRKIALVNLEHECSLCGETNLDKLDIHHIDYNNKNNDIDNLMFACKKCHQNILHKRERDSKGRYL